MGKWRGILILLMLIVFLAGLFVFLYPYVQKNAVEGSIQQTVQEFRDLFPVKVETDDEPENHTGEETPSRQYRALWDAMVAYNETLYAENQTELTGSDSYETPSFILAEYGLESEAIGVLTIPAVDFEMPIFLGATKQHLQDGVAQLSQTSLPIGGNNTNCVIAGHRGWGGTSYFRYVTNLEIGDKIFITNLWEVLAYEVVATKIIEPYDIEEILIQPSKDVVTLLTCHPYASGGRQRYLVYCERVIETEKTEVHND